MRSQTAVAAVGATLIALCSAGSARADLKVVSEMTVTGLPKTEMTSSGTQKSTSTAYYKGDKFRQEAGDSISIFDCGTGQVYTLDQGKKTYSVMAADDMLNMANNPMLAKMKMDVSGDVTPTDKTETITDKTTKEYLFTFTMKMGMEGMDSSIFPTMKMSGEQWNTTSIRFPANCVKMMQFTQRMPGMFGSSMKTFAEKMAAMPGFPMRKTMTITMEGGAVAAMTKDPIVMTTEVKSISEDKLPDSLFAVPSGYTKVDPPKMSGGTMPQAQ